MVVHTPAKDRKQRNTEVGSAQLNQSAASSQNFSQNNSKSKAKEPSAQDAAKTTGQEGARPGAEEEDMVVTKLWGVREKI